MRSRSHPSQILTLAASTEAPRYRRGTSVNLGLDVLQFVASAITIVYLWHANRQKQKKLDAMSQEERDAVLADRTRTRADTDPTFKCACARRSKVLTRADTL